MQKSYLGGTNGPLWCLFSLTYFASVLTQTSQWWGERNLRGNACPQHPRGDENMQSHPDSHSDGSKGHLFPCQGSSPRWRPQGIRWVAGFQSLRMTWQRGTRGIPNNKRNMDRETFSTVVGGNWLWSMGKGERDVKYLRWFVRGKRSWFSHRACWAVGRQLRERGKCVVVWNSTWSF